MRPKMYISGKITGRSRCDTETEFSRGVRDAVGWGFVPYSPLRNGLPKCAPWLLHMIVDIIIMMRCDAVYMLKSWIDSRGAKIEYKIAKKLKKTIYYED